MAAEAVCLGLDKGRPLSFPGPGHRLTSNLVDCGHVHAVDHRAGDAVADGPVGDVGYIQRATGGHGDGIQVIFADEDHRQAPDGGQVYALVEATDVGGAVPEETDGHLVGFSKYRGKPGAGGDGDS